MATYKTAEVAAMIGVSYMAMQINTAGVSSRSIAKWFEKENCTNGYGVCCG